MDKYHIDLEFTVDFNRHKVEAFYPIGNNGYCEKNFFILTSNPAGDHTNYLCQCACNGWCTSGHRTAQEAVDEYRAMCSRYQDEKRSVRLWDMPI